jgi:hypothetical protein
MCPQLNLGSLLRSDFEFNSPQRPELSNLGPILQALANSAEPQTVGTLSFSEPILRCSFILIKGKNGDFEEFYGLR